MHDPFDNPEIAAASQVLRGATGKSGRADDVDQSNFRAPRAVTRGAFAFLRPPGGRPQVPGRPPPAPTAPFRPPRPDSAS
ncbi:MAG: hypothetical protein J0M21_13620 [Xanthomonadales bacterium]|nr:hypothetical protein [Xanthomonadales bacterium]